MEERFTLGNAATPATRQRPGQRTRHIELSLECTLQIRLSLCPNDPPAIHDIT